jgi:hypothetical protein
MEFTENLFNDICSQVANGTALRKVLRDKKINPNQFYPYLRANPEADKQYAYAKERMADAMLDEIIEIADETSRDIIQTDDGHVIDGFAAQRARVMIDTRKWAMGKLLPKKYGDKLQQDNISSDGSMSPQAALDPDMLARKAAFMLRDEMERQKKNAE